MMKVEKPPRMNNIGIRYVTRPTSKVAMKQKNWMPVGMAIASEAALNSDKDNPGRPVVNMWWTHKPKLKKPVPIAASTIQE